MKGIVLSLILVAAGIGISIPVGAAVEASRPKLPENYADTDLSFNGSNLKGFAFGMEGLIADLYYMRSLQYVGDKLLSDKGQNVSLDDLRVLDPRLLHPFLEIATDLDPQYLAAYWYGAIVLPAIDREKAISLAKKGIENNPSDWSLHQHLGYIYWRLGRYDEAAATYDQGAYKPGASPFLRLMAAAMKTEGGSRETARAIYTEMLATTNDKQVAITAERRIAQLDSLDERDEIDKALAAANAETGRCVGNLKEILPRLQKTELPGGRGFRIDSANRLVDPTGAPYLLDRESCRVKPDPEKTGIPIN